MAHITLGFRLLGLARIIRSHDFRFHRVEASGLGTDHFRVQHRLVGRRHGVAVLHVIYDL